MATITKLYPMLKQMGLDDQTSQEFIEVIEDTHTVKLGHVLERVATKDELFKVREDLSKEIVLVRGEVSEVKERMSLMREDLSKEISDIIKWNVGTLIAVTAIVLTIVKLLG